MDRGDKDKEEKKESAEKKDEKRSAVFSPNLIGAIADEVSKNLVKRFPSVMRRPKKKPKVKKPKKIEHAILLDTSAIIDGRIFDVISTGILNGSIVVLHSVLLELKRLADSQDAVKRERGRRGLERLEKLRKEKYMQLITPDADDEKKFEKFDVDERLVRLTKYHKGKLVTCDYNLEKKSIIENVKAININALANCLKVIAVPGEALHIQIAHKGKDVTQGVGYMDDGTMIVVEQGHDLVGKSANVVVSRVIQTASGRILFAKRI
jgi:uncharacterized protein YacL